jgi:hypothetical protein
MIVTIRTKLACDQGKLVLNVLTEKTTDATKITNKITAIEVILDFFCLAIIAASFDDVAVDFGNLFDSRLGNRI